MERFIGDHTSMGFGSICRDSIYHGIDGVPIIMVVSNQIMVNKIVGKGIANEASLHSLFCIVCICSGKHQCLVVLE